ncbi:MAG: hypothetical protein Q9225_006897 [Loekoesia sp. 1 TL-2023]
MDVVNFTSVRKRALEMSDVIPIAKGAAVRILLPFIKIALELVESKKIARREKEEPGIAQGSRAQFRTLSKTSMQQTTRTVGLDLRSLRSRRSSSISNDRASLSITSLPFPPAVDPDPAYIAPSSASQIVTGDHESTLEEGDEEEETGGLGPMNALVAPDALGLVNAFLDQLLYSFLASSRSTSIVSLRPAVTEVLKPRLAKDAIACADAELQEFLGGEDDDDLSAFHHGTELRGHWDLNMIWRRTRLRCMVYTRLGDLEEEDEEMWVERENLAHKADGRNRLSRDLGVVSPAAAIFLTSILEFIGEQVLLVSGKVAYTRFEARRRQEKHSVASVFNIQRPSVEVVDIEKLAVNTTFGRLWRSWKKKVRPPSITSQRPSSREFLLRPASSMSTSGSRSRKTSIGETRELHPDSDALRRPSPADMEMTREAAAVPLPATTDNESVIEESRVHIPDSRRDLERPRSMMAASDACLTADQLNGERMTGALSSKHALLRRDRSSSLPHLASREYVSPQASLFLTPREGPPLVTSQGSPGGYPRYDADLAAVATTYDGAILPDQGVTRDSEDEALYPSSISTQTKAGTEMRNLDDGSDELATASDEYRPANEAIPSDSAKDRKRSPFPKPATARTFSATDGTIEKTKIQQQIPSQVESRLESMRMQGYTAGNASLDNRANEDFTLRSFDDKAPQSNNPESEDAPADFKSPVSYVNYGQLDGASSATRDLSATKYGSIPRSHPDNTTNSSYPVSNQSPTFGQAKLPTKVPDIRKQLPPVSTSVERAAVQRVSPSPGSALESPTGRTSTSSSRDHRPIHTSGSNTSQKAAKVRDFAGRGSTDTNRQFTVSRASSEGSGSIVKTPKVDETQRSFEQLINSDETIQYTLTPQSVREMDVSDDL